MYVMDVNKMSESEKSFTGRLFKDIVQDIINEHPEVVKEMEQLESQKGAE